MAIKSFTGLKVWQEAHKLVLMIYRVTKNFPKEELFSLVNQMRKSCYFYYSNIAEGFSRQNLREKLQFYYIALSLLTKL